VAAALACVLFVTSGAAVRAQSMETALAPGPWAVGFSDTSCSSSALRSGPVDVAIWYPARAPASIHLTYRSYVTAGERGDTAAARRAIEELSTLFVSHGAPGTAVRAWLDASMLATRAARAAGPRFPLVLVAQGNMQTVPDQASLAEYLASHGYVVASSPSPMRLTGPLADEADVGRRADEQAQLLTCAHEAADARSDVAGLRYALVGHSFGARAALLLAMRDQQVAALVSLDGGIGTATGRAAFEAVPSFNPGAVRAPVLHFYERLDSFMTPDFTLLRALHHADRWLVEVPGLHHYHFTSLGAVTVDQPSLRTALGATEETARGYAAMASATLTFLDAFLSENGTARERLGAQGWPQLGEVQRLTAGER
jgi:dienelactone hydrolase